MYSRIKMYKNFHLRTYRFSCGDRNRLKSINKISYIPTYEDEMMHKAYQTYRYFPLLKHRGVYFPLPANKDRAVNSIEIKDFIILWTYSQWRQAIVVIPPFLSRTGNVLCSFHLDANAFLRSFAFSSSTILPSVSLSYEDVEHDFSLWAFHRYTLTNKFPFSPYVPLYT